MSGRTFISTVKMEQCGKVPFFPRDLTLGMDVLDVPTDRIFSERYNSKLSAECVLALMDFVQCDATVGCIFSYGLECFGGVTKYPPDGIPYVSGNPFTDFYKIEEHDPSEIICDLTKGFRESCSIVKERRPDTALMVNVPGPMTMAGFARGVETLMMDLEINRDIADRLLEFSTEAVSHEMEFVSKDIADGVFFASATDNPDMVGISNYLGYSVRNVAKLVRKVHDDGLICIYHPHGTFSTDDRQDILKASIDTGTDGFQFSEGNEPEGIMAQTHGKCSIMGGVNAYSTLLLGPDYRIRRDTDRFIQALKDEPYVAMCSCSVHRKLPLNNLKIMSDTIHRYNAGIE